MAKSPRLPLSDAHLSFYCWLIQVIFLLCFLSILLWKCLTPQPPRYTITNTSFNDGRNLTSVVLDLKITNPNQGYRVYYNHMSISLEGSIVGNRSVSNFDSGFGETSFQRVVVNATKRGTLDVVRLRLVVGVEYEDKVIAMRSKRKEMVYEADLRVGVDGKTEGGKEVAMVRNRRRARREGDGEEGSSSYLKTSRKFGTFGMFRSNRKNL